MTHERTTRARTPATTLATRLERQAAEQRAGTYPLVQYQTDPVRYARERLHVELMPEQEAILRAVAAGINGSIVDGRKAPPRVAVRSGQKCGKTLVAIVACLWFYECFPDARVFLCAAIEKQTKMVLWRELGSVLRHARSCGVDIDGKAAASPTGGFVSTDGSREIRGLSGRDIESLAGLSGAQLMVVDEASALPETKAQVFEGNQMGGGTSGILMISNPTRTSGPFYAAFNEEAEYWQTFHIDGEAVADWQARTGRRIPFTVSREKIEEARERYGEKSPFWLLRIKGEFLRNEAGRCVPMTVIDEAVERYATAVDDGPLVIGYDVAGAAAGGDLHAWAPVRGKKCAPIHTREGLSIDAALAETYWLLSINRRRGEIPRVNVDAEGPIGSVAYARLRDEAEQRLLHDRANAFEVVAIRSSSRTVRQTAKFEGCRSHFVAQFHTVA
jgi:phage terminase large subunit